MCICLYLDRISKRISNIQNKLVILAASGEENQWPGLGREGNFIVYPFLFLRVVISVNVLLVRNRFKIKKTNHMFHHLHIYPHNFFFLNTHKF